MARSLLLPPDLTPSARRVRDAATRRGLLVRQPAPTDDAEPAAHHVHAGPTFADAVAPRHGIALLEPPMTWLAELPHAMLGREIAAMPIAEAWRLRYPAFIKSPNDKSLRAMVYTDGTRLPGADAVDPATIVLVSGVVAFTAEYRFHLLDGRVHASSQYSADGGQMLGPVPESIAGPAAALLAEVAATLPSGIVVDLGVLDGRLVVVEANAAWASGIYAADPEKALDVILRASCPADEVAARDRRFLRPSAGLS